MIAATIQTPHVDWLALSPSLALLGASAVALFSAVLVPAWMRRSVAATAAFVGFVVAAVFAVVVFNHTPTPESLLADSMDRDRLAALAQLILSVTGATIVFVSWAERRRHGTAEYYALLTAAVAGMAFFVSASNLMTLFLGLEWFSLCLYVLVAIDTDRATSLEAGLKYVIVGGFGSAVLLFGSALVYGATGQLGFSQIAAANAGDDAFLVAGLAMILAGLAFKISAAPFHMWTPDVYQGAPTPVVAFMSAATKVAAFFALIRVLDVALQPLTWDWTPVIYALAIASIVVGSVLAIAQRDVKRMLAYSSVAHAGFILTGLTAPNAIGIRSAMFYLIVYSLMTIGAFAVVMLVASRGEERTSLDAYAGLARRSPGLAAVMAVFLLSLAGIPPTAGFIAKVTVFSAAIGAGNWPLAVVGVVGSVVAAFFYLRVIVYMYMREPAEALEPDRSLMPLLAAGVLAVGIFVLGIFPGILTGILDPASVVRW
jgi:NADH-quinone oxidoreductase subunit N